MDLEGYSYRTSARYGSRTSLIIGEAGMTVTGPRIGPLAYNLWIALQVVLLFLIIPAAVFPIVFSAYWYLFIIPGLLLMHLLIGGTGAAVLWEAANLASLGKGQKGETIVIPLENIKDVSVGKGWARNGLWIVIPYAVPLVNKAAEGFCVSFEAPQFGDHGREKVFAFHMQSRRQAEKLREAVSK